MKQFNNILVKITVTLLIAAMAVSFCSCGQTEKTSNESSGDAAAAISSVGKGKQSFNFSATGADGKTQEFIVNTNEKYVGKALLKAGIVEGEDSEYGLMIMSVNGEKHDYNDDGMYWAFYIDGNYATAGVDQTEITAGSHYELKAEK